MEENGSQTLTQPVQNPPQESKPPASIGTDKKNKQPAIIFTLILILFILGIAGFFAYQHFFSQSLTTPTTTKPELYKGKITIGYVTWPGYLGLFLARDKGYFKEEGLDVELKHYDGGTPLTKDFINGHIQGRADLTLDTIDESYQGLDHKVVLVIDYSNGADGIISTSNIKNFQDIKGKKFAFEKGSLEEFFTDYVLQQNQLSARDIIPVDLNPEKAAEALENGQVDLATTYEPFLTKTLDKIHGNKIYSSAQAPGLITDILTFRTDFIEQNPEAVKAVLKAYFKGVQFWKDNPSEANKLIGKELNITADEAELSLKGIKVLSINENQTAFTFAAGLQSIYINMRTLGEFVKNRQTSSSAKIDTDLLIEAKFIKNLTSENN